MTKPKEIADSLRRIASSGEAIDERSDSVMLSGTLLERNDRLLWNKLRLDTPPYIESITFRLQGTDDELQPDEKISANSAYDISIAKLRVPRELSLLLTGSLPLALSSEVSNISRIRVAELCPEESFCTGLFCVEEWDDDKPNEWKPFDPVPDARRFVKDFTGENRVPSDIRPWLIGRLPERRGAAFKIWAGTAANNLTASLVDHVSLTSSSVVYHLGGPPNQTFSLSNDAASTAIDALQAAASWVYLDGKDADARHIFYAAELARAYSAGNFGAVAERSLASAQLAYKSHVKSASRETIKAMADLRKNVAEESQRITQRAQDLSGALWRDLAVAAAPFLLKTLPSSAENTLISIGFPAVAGVFLVFSFSLQVWLNKKSMRQQDETRQLWARLSTPFLSKDDIVELSDTPISVAKTTYRWARFYVGAVYSILVVALFFWTYSNI